VQTGIDSKPPEDRLLSRFNQGLQWGKSCSLGGDLVSVSGPDTSAAVRTAIMDASFSHRIGLFTRSVSKKPAAALTRNVLVKIASALCPKMHLHISMYLHRKRAGVLEVAQTCHDSGLSRWGTKGTNSRWFLTGIDPVTAST
jgi:hypothetical protein